MFKGRYDNCGRKPVSYVLKIGREGSSSLTSATTPPVGLLNHWSGISKFAGGWPLMLRAGTQETIMVGCLKLVGHASVREVSTRTTSPSELRLDAHELKCWATDCAFESLVDVSLASRAIASLVGRIIV